MLPGGSAAGRRELLRVRGPNFALVLVISSFGILGACGRGASTSQVEREQRDPDPPASDDASPTAQPGVRITPDLVEDLEVVELEGVDAPSYASGRVGEPTVLLRGKGLRLGAPHPLTRDRGPVSVYSDGLGSVLQSKVIDLTSGRVVSTVDEIDYVYPHVGVALGWSKVQGREWNVLVHGEDGHVVPLWPQAEAEQHVAVIHPVGGGAWTFEASSDPEPIVRYAAWSDLRKSPPPPTEVIQGGLPEWDARRPRGWYGPDLQSPVDGPLLVEPKDAPEQCEKLEMLPSGHRCVSSEMLSLAGGWSIAREPNTGVLVSAKGPADRRRLELGDDCEVRSAWIDPPRALIRCDGHSGPYYLWSPEETRTVPRDALVVTHDESRRGTMWIDLQRSRLLHHPTADTEMKYVDTRWTFFRDPPRVEPGVVDLDAAEAHRLPVNQGCARLGIFSVELPWVAITCHQKTDRVRSVEVFDLERHRHWRLPAVREMWLQPDRSRVVGLIARGADTRVVSWTLD